ncbi:MAG: c-type cytochrome [Epsilonproteobacteria bacterium]|nr:c-type cytochrome [Campylobacterota bacterium]
MKIVLSAVLALVLLGCGEDSKTQTHKVENKVAPHEVVKQVETKVAPKETVEQVVEKHVQTVTHKVEEVKKEVVKHVEKVIPKKEEVKQAIKEVTTVDAKVLFKTCAGCHGASGEKVALGKSKVIKGWDASKVTTALNGYKDGTYGGAMKGLMKAQVSKLSEADIKALAGYISKL